jgi:hypothetical protein
MSVPSSPIGGGGVIGNTPVFASSALPHIDWSAPDAIQQRDNALSQLPPVSSGFRQNDPSAVMKIQVALGLNATGNFDIATENALKSFQAAHGCFPDGKCGRRTWTALMGGSGDQLPTAGYQGLDLTNSYIRGEDLTGFEGSNPYGASLFGAPSRFNKYVRADSLKNDPFLQWCYQHAQDMGLVITATTNGNHAEHSLHYEGCALDVGGGSDALRQQYFNDVKAKATEMGITPHEVAYKSQFEKDGVQMAGLSDHETHVHVSYRPATLPLGDFAYRA